MSNSTIVSIIEKYSTGILSADEERLLNDWLDGVSPEEFHQTLDACSVLPDGLREHPILSTKFTVALERALDEADGQDKVIPLFQWKRWAAVAAVLALLAGGGWLWLSHKTDSGAVVKNDVAPGINGAILTLADGRRIVLDSTDNGFSAVDGKTKITKGSGDQLVYERGTGETEIRYNTISTPRGRKISISLADGTKVWLNAGSSIKVPTAFKGPQRLVEFSGEAYFEVAANAKQPFLVKKMGSDYTVQVLGTQFDVNAYDDEDAIKTTLLEGAVRIRNKVLKPGEQAVAGSNQGELIIVPNVNTEAVMAWKNGIFNFDRADIHTVMRQISRWYNVDVDYKGAIDRHFGGTISQDVNVSQVLKLLEGTGAVHFTIEGRKIIVKP